jgi:hypothetical protein
MAFDVASIKPSKGGFVTSNFPLDPSERKGRCPPPPYSTGTHEWGGGDATRFSRVPQKDYGATNGRLTADGTLAEYVEFAYKVPFDIEGSGHSQHRFAYSAGIVPADYPR